MPLKLSTILLALLFMATGIFLFCAYFMAIISSMTGF